MGRKLAVGLIGLYQRVSKFTPPTCKFYPSCSEYTAQAILRFGVMKGCLLGAWRILRCNPFSKGGFDPVPGTVETKHE